MQRLVLNVLLRLLGAALLQAEQGNVMGSLPTAHQILHDLPHH